MEKLNVQEILATYDNMFGKYSLTEIEAYLREMIEKAKDDPATLFTLLNEMIGFCRDTTQKEKALLYCDKLLQLLENMNLKGSVEYATALLNIANAYRAFELLTEAIHLFEYVEKIYKEKLQENDFGFANLYNNWGLVYQETGEYKQAEVTLKKALRVVDLYEEAEIPQATTRTNLAASLLNIGTEEAYEEAVEYLQRAIAIHEKYQGQDFHYGATLVALGDAYCCQKKFVEASETYEAGLREIEKHTGKNDNYTRVLEKCQYAKKQAGKAPEKISNLERSQAFYESCGRKMIHEKFSEYEERIAVGMVGEGSDCYGFDDEISADHDYEVGFCMWLTQDDYKVFGKELQDAYDEITNSEGRLKERRGVFTINEFYGKTLGSANNYEKGCPRKVWEAEEFRLAEATNGIVFRDDLGVFTKVRKELLSYYPERIWRERLAEKLHAFSQYAQSNYARMMARGDVLTASICIAKAVESAMDIIYLLNRSYAPYYKWKKKGAEKFLLSKDIFPRLEKIVNLPMQENAWNGVRYDASFINKKDLCVVLFEEVAQAILRELQKQELVDGQDAFLERYVKQVLEGRYIELVEEIVTLEWEQFDKVKNEGGRADCQDNWNTFSIMRKSQYLTWPKELLMNFHQDLLVAKQKNWNLIMEKYARMMESTCPEKYEQLSREIPILTPERIAIQEEVIRIQVSWMEAFKEQYPKMAGNARGIHTSEDNLYNTSYETYLRGEISTYSERTFLAYSRFIVSLLKEKHNLAEKIMGQTAFLYGYDSLKHAEHALRG